jgi:hypothetical protein
MATKYRNPMDVLGLDKSSPMSTQAIADWFRQRFHSKQMEDCAPEELQNICSSFLILMLLEARRDQKATTSLNHQVIHNTQYNVHTDNINITFQKEKEAFEQHKLQLLEWGNHLQSNLFELESQLHSEQNMAANLKKQLSKMEEECHLMAKRAICAPQYFDSLHEFITKNCVQHPDERVSSEDFHRAFTTHMTAIHSNMERPNQRDLTAVMKRLGLNNEQVYVHGGNARGFKGLGLHEQGTIQVEVSN